MRLSELELLKPNMFARIRRLARIKDDLTWLGESVARQQEGQVSPPIDAALNITQRLLDAELRELGAEVVAELDSETQNLPAEGG